MHDWHHARGEIRCSGLQRLDNPPLVSLAEWTSVQLSPAVWTTPRARLMVRARIDAEGPASPYANHRLNGTDAAQPSSILARTVQGFLGRG